MGFFKKKDKADNRQVEHVDSQIEQVQTKQGRNPYINAREEWLERYGTYIKQAQNWRAVAFFMIVITILSITGNVIQASQMKVVPYIVEVDKLGRSNLVSRADTASINPERLIQSVVGSAMVDWRTVTADIELQNNMIARLSYFFAGSAKGIIKEWYEKNNPFEVAKTGKLVHVELKSLPLLVGKNSYRIEWTETVRNHGGITLETQDYEATVIIQVAPPANEQTLIYNPGGVYITSISTSKIFINK